MIIDSYRFTPPAPPDLADIQALFSGGVTGIFIDLTDPAYLWDDAARSTPASLNSRVRGLTDLSGNGAHGSTSATTHLRRDASGQGYVESPATTNLRGFISTTASFGSSSGMTWGTVYRADAYTAEMSAISADRSSNGSFLCHTLTGADAGSIRATFPRVGGSITVSESGTHTAGLDVVITCRSDMAGGIIRRNGVQVASGAWSGVTPRTETSVPISIAAGYANAGDNWWRCFDGRIYAAWAISASLSDAEIDMVEAYVSALVGM